LDVDLSGRAKEVAKQQAQQSAAKVVVSVECDPSLKAGLKETLLRAGFRNMTDYVTTLFRDSVAGRIKYKAGILQSQEQISPT
jgi:hypothetical protein